MAVLCVCNFSCVQGIESGDDPEFHGKSDDSIWLLTPEAEPHETRPLSPYIIDEFEGWPNGFTCVAVAENGWWYALEAPSLSNLSGLRFSLSRDLIMFDPLTSTGYRIQVPRVGLSTFATYLYSKRKVKVTLGALNYIGRASASKRYVWYEHEMDTPSGDIVLNRAVAECQR